RFHSGGAPGLHLCPDTDGHVTRTPGTLLTVATADCVPIFVVDPALRAVAVLHGGWRGVAAGVLDRGLEVLAERLSSRVEDVAVHLGPAICGRCYEVGPEVHDALGLPVPETAAPVDLRAVVATRAVEAGVAAARVTVSDACTRCGDSPFFSHRGGDVERQLAFVGIDPTGPGAE
ncbi:MAG: polyphenol oxidase family protein, partial [Gemmatimonadota bacterium]